MSDKYTDAERIQDLEEDKETLLSVIGDLTREVKSLKTAIVTARNEFRALKRYNCCESTGPNSECVYHFQVENVIINLCRPEIIESVESVSEKG